MKTNHSRLTYTIPGFFTSIALAILLLSSCHSGQVTRIDNLQVEYIQNPLGIDVTTPRFSWNIYSSQRAVYQQAYQIITGENEKDVRNETGTLWDSGKIPGGQTLNLVYAGVPLKSNTKYYWRVRVWLDDEKFVWSQPSLFHTGILDDVDWKAQWITTREEIIHESPLLRKEFQADKKIKNAFAFVTACGYYELFLNGKKVGDHVMDPAVTDYRETILYSTYDVTSLIKAGNNAVGAMLGNGAWNMRKVEDRWSWGNVASFLGNPAFLLQLMITYEDGSQSLVTSDESWKYAAGPVTFNNIYGGEDYDARKELSGWSETEFNDTGWQAVMVSGDPKGRLKSQMMPAIKVTGTIQPVKMTNPEPGVYLYDLGQNIAGWWRLQVKASPGQVIRIRGAETLNDSLFPKPLEEGDKLSTKFRYHSHTWTDYTVKGEALEVYEPRFFYTGFRYMEVTTSDRKDPEQLSVEGRVVRSALERNGRFESSDSLLNKIHRAGLWSQMGNTLGYPTDCPHREKGAYNGDGQVIAETSIHDFQMASFYTKWLNDMRDGQEENGRIPNTSPILVGGMGGGVAWGSAYILIPWWMNHYYLDTRVLQEHYPNMKKYLQYLENLGTIDENPGEPYIINYFDGYWYSLGEWCAPGQHDCPNHAVVNTFYYYYNSLLFSKIADLLGYAEDAQYFRALSDTVKNAFIEKFFNPATSLYGTEETYQTYQLLALVGNLIPEGFRESVLQTIIDDINMRNGHLNTGIIGTKYLWPVLVQAGQNELAYQVATQTTYPSFGYWLMNGSTTLLEEWSGANSHNHQMFGSVSEYFYKFLAGIQSPMEGNTSKAYTHIYIEPYVPEKLEYVNSSVETVAGMIVSEWKKEGSSFNHLVTIPANSTASLALPAIDPGLVTVYEGNTIIWEKNQPAGNVTGITEVKAVKDRVMVNIRSGTYSFRVEGK